MKKKSSSELSDKETLGVPVQTILFHLTGQIVESSGSIAELAERIVKNSNLFQYFPIVENLVSILTNDIKEDSIEIPKVEVRWNTKLYRIYDLTLERIKQNSLVPLKCTILDLTDHYGKLTSTQQERNEKVIKEQSKA
ncbi:MAG: hypothetical protein AAF849_13585 [Bacteroidota bacterium]